MTHPVAPQPGFMQVCMYVCMYVCVCMYVYVCMYVCIIDSYLFSYMYRRERCQRCLRKASHLYTYTHTQTNTHTHTHTYIPTFIHVQQGAMPTMPAQSEPPPLHNPSLPSRGGMRRLLTTTTEVQRVPMTTSNSYIYYAQVNLCMLTCVCVYVYVRTSV
jgi:hypothetical protein